STAGEAGHPVTSLTTMCGETSIGDPLQVTVNLMGRTLPRLMVANGLLQVPPVPLIGASNPLNVDAAARSRVNVHGAVEQPFESMATTVTVGSPESGSWSRAGVNVSLYGG